MKRLVIDLPDDYADAVTITAIGHTAKIANNVTNVICKAFDLDSGTHFSFNGKEWEQEVKE